MAKINSLLEKRLELAEYEKEYGDLPAALIARTLSVEEQAVEEESDYQSSSDQLDGSEEPIKEVA